MGQDKEPSAGLYAYLQRRYTVIAVLMFFSSGILIVSLALRSQMHAADLLSNFCLFAFVILILNFICAFTLRKIKIAYVFLALILYLSFYMSEYTQRAPTLDLLGSTPGDTSLLAMSYNVNTANKNFQAVCEFILTENPDIILLLEVNARWIEELESLKQRYPYRHIIPRSDNFGIALYSQYPMDAKTLLSPEPFLPAISADISINGSVIHCTGIHTLPPISLENWQASHSQIHHLLKTLSATDHHILMGDLNATPNALIYRKIVATDFLQPTGNYFSSTWGSFDLLQLDHIFVSRNIQVGKSTIHPKLGSDHHPISLQFSIGAD